MNRTNIFILGAVVGLGLATGLRAEGTNQLADEKARVSYAIGLNFGHGFKQQNLDLDPELVGRGIKDVLSGGPELMTEAEVKETLTAFQKEFRAKQQARMMEMAAKSKAMGDTFLATNKNTPGVVCLPDGLQYQIITAGTGQVPTAADMVKVNYRGTLVDGTVFDSGTHEFGVTQVIRGWTEALEKMPAGSKWKLFIPSELAYGEQGRPGIPPNSVLIFEVELLDVKTPPPPSPPPAPLTSDIIKVPSKSEMDKGAKIEVIKADEAAKATNGSK